MEYTVPQFIEKESKVVGPFTFKQFIFIAIAGVICLVLYFAVGTKSFLLFLFLSSIVISLGFALAIVKVNNLSLPQLVQYYFLFLVGPKRYFWQKKQFFSKVARKTEMANQEIKKDKEESILKVAQKSRLGEINKFLETKTK